MNKVRTHRVISYSALMGFALTFLFLFSFNFISAGKWDLGPSTGGGGNVIFVNGTTAFNTTQFDYDDKVSIDISWLNTFIQGVSKWNNYYTSSQVNNLFSSYYLKTQIDDLITSIGNFSNWNKNYNDLINKPVNLSQFVDDLGYHNYVDTWINNTFYNKTQSDSRYLQSFTELDPIWNSEKGDYYLKSNPFNFYNSTTLQNLSQLNDDLGYSNYDDSWINDTFYNKTQSDSRYLQSFTELDPYYFSNPYNYLNESYNDNWINNTFYNKTESDNKYYPNTNPSNFINISQVPLPDMSSYYNKTEIDNKGYLTSESDPNYFSNPNQYYNSTTLPTYPSYSSSDFNLSKLKDVDDTNKGLNKTLMVNSAGKHIYVDFPESGGDTSNLVPYTGATKDVNLGGKSMIVDKLGVGSDLTGQPATIKMFLKDGTFRMMFPNNDNAYLFQAFSKALSGTSIGMALHNGPTSDNQYLWLASSGNYWAGTPNKMIIASSTNSPYTQPSRDLWIFANNDLGTSNPHLALIANQPRIGVNQNYASYALDVNGEVAADDFITRTATYDKSKGSALDLIRDASELREAKSGKIDHSKFYGYVAKEEERPIINGKKIIEEIEYDRDGQPTGKMKKIEVDNIVGYENVTITGVSIVDEIELLRQAIYELKVKNEELQTQIDFIMGVNGTSIDTRTSVEPRNWWEFWR